MSVSDAEKFKSSQMNKNSADAAESCAGGVKIVFIGNSITIHAVMPEIGWHHEWGMAASSKENDYVHLVIRGIERETGRPADARIRNLADFERGLLDYDHERDRDLIDFQPDYLVFALGENVPALESDAEPIWYKRTAFKHENEVRAIFHEVGTCLEGMPVKMDLNIIIERVYISPSAPSWFAILVKRVMNKYGLNKPVEYSRLDEKPIY